MKRDLNLLIFDLDGTLYPVSKAMDNIYPKSAIHLLAKKSGRELQELQTEFLRKKEELRMIIKGKPTSTLTLLYYYDVSFTEFEDEVNKRMDVDAYLQLDPRAVSTIELIAANYAIFLYTTNNGKITDRILNRIGMRHIFPPEKCLTFSDIGKMPLSRQEKLRYIKPHSEGFRYILKQSGIAPQNVLMIGDSETADIVPAQNLGMQTYHVQDRESFYALPAWLGII
jgi:FMN phosphatase YigB (HAD superfamily)